VRELIHMRTLHLGPDELLVAVKVEFTPELDLARLAAAVDGLEARIRSAAPIARVIYVEPDIARAASRA
jgi:divalent metal cation (Fe/Co/Zn/Cd) transporter